MVVNEKAPYASVVRIPRKATGVPDACTRCERCALHSHTMESIQVILLLAVLIGLLAGLLRSHYHRQPFTIPVLRASWLVVLAFAPQWVAFYLPVFRRAISDPTAAVALVTSQLLLLVFGWHNRRHQAFWLLNLGLLCNLLVIVSNGGLMPISPETVQRLRPDRAITTWQVGERLGATKDRLLPVAETRFSLLADRFTLPTWIPYRVAFSLGDLLIAGGVLLFLWHAGSPQSTIVSDYNNEHK